MAANKTPLHSVVSVICDLVAELTPEDQLRSLEAARVSLGLRAPRVASDLNPYQETVLRVPLPLVEVEMMGGTPRVVNPQAAPGGTARPNRLLVTGTQRAITPLRQLSAPADPVAQIQAVRGYVRPLR